jgi:hypothetical protein
MVGGATGLWWSAPARPKMARENFSNLLFITEISSRHKVFWQRLPEMLEGYLLPKSSFW